MKEEKLELVMNGFAKRMFQRLEEKEEQGFKGWDENSIISNLEERLKRKIEKFIKNKDYGRSIDIANFVMFLDYLYRVNDPDRIETP